MIFKHEPIHDFTDIKSVTIPNKGRWYTTPSGIEYPSITTVLGQKEKPWLKTWTQMLGPDKAAKEQKRCAERGIAVHEMIEFYLNNDEIQTKNYNNEYIRGFNQLKPLLNHIDKIRAQEVALWSDKLRVAGRVDCVGFYDGVLSIIDFKTSNNNKTKEMIGDYRLQATAYAIMWHEMTGESIEQIVILITVEKGLVPLVFKDTIYDHIQPLLKRIKEYESKI